MNVVEENRREKISTQLFTSSDEASRIVAKEIVNLLKKKEKDGKKTILGLATGSTPIGIYKELIRFHKKEGVSFNNLIGKEVQIGEIKIFPYELCLPCKHLEQMVNGKNIVKEFLKKGGLRCKILSSGTVKIGDEIKPL